MGTCGAYRRLSFDFLIGLTRVTEVLPPSADGMSWYRNTKASIFADSDHH